MPQNFKFRQTVFPVRTPSFNLIQTSHLKRLNQTTVLALLKGERLSIDMTFAAGNFQDAFYSEYNRPNIMR